ncbi:MAG TPA: FAD-dependent oxidoreductase [Candidatus Binatia bacterium]|jgi:NADH dehydrogenase|nr:FAD-dependent oxidoreductase [Candidatus Binatia bacterium]
MDKKRIIIVGGGFGGVKCAETLARELAGSEADVVLFDRQNHLVFSPLLAEVVGSSINSLDVIVPLRQLLPKSFCRTEEVRAIDLAKSEIEYQAEDGQGTRMRYDHLVIACGSVTNLNVVPGMADHSFPLKTVADAAALRSHIMTQMERAEVASQPERRNQYLTVLVVGGGYSGVEAAGEINDLLRDSARYFRNWKVEDVKVVLIHSRDQILPEISPELREFARKKMEAAGVQMVLNARVNSATPEGVTLEGGQCLKGGTIVCTIGSAPAPVVAGLAASKEKGRLLAEPDMRLKGMNNVWAIGDCACIINARNGEPSPTTGQFAERQGRQCAQNIVRVLKGQPTRPFQFKLLGELCSIGGHKAVADLFGLHLSGFLAWFVWRGVYLFKLPTWGRRFQVGFDWASLLLFPRDLAHVRIEQTDRVSHAHYNAGEFIFRQGEPPTNFYVLEKGEVEVVRATNGSDGEVVAVLGAGSFFGERALIGNRPRVMSIRARTPVEVLVMGRNVFAQMSGALAPLKEALAQTLNRRAVDVWKDRPQVYDLLKRTTLKELMEPVPQPLLKPEATMREVGQAFVERGHEFFFVSSDGQTLEGVVTITDLLRGQTNNSHSDPKTPVSEIMTRNPVVVAVDDDCAVAATTMREYRLKTLPVVERKEGRKLVGCLRVRRLMAYVLKESGTTASGDGSRK